ncbi:MAG: Aquaporin, partial [Labilithrix sp.]|nr:Aquaporin [Labilithrix sp.]
MVENDVTVRRRAAALGGATGFGLALVVSCGIVFLRILGPTAASSVTANALTTFVAVVAVLATVRTFLTSFDPSAFDPRTRERRIRSLVLGQALGAVLGVLTIHAAVRHGLDTHPWLREHPRQLVNDLVAVFGVFAFV